jgi:hypothetical protein
MMLRYGHGKVRGWQEKGKKGDTMSAVAAAGQTYADTILRALDSERVWLQQAQERYLGTLAQEETYRERKTAYQIAWQRWLVLAELARDCGIID